MNMKLLSVVAPPSIYHGCSTRKDFLEEKFAPVNMRNSGHHNLGENREIKDGEKYIILDIYLNFGSLNKMKITSSELEYYFGK